MSIQPLFIIVPKQTTFDCHSFSRTGIEDFLGVNRFLDAVMVSVKRTLKKATFRSHKQDTANRI